MQRYLPTEHTTPTTTTNPQPPIPQHQPIAQPPFSQQQPAIPSQPIYSHFGGYQPPVASHMPQSQPFANQLYNPYGLPQQQLHLVSQMQTQLLNTPSPQPPMQPPQQQYPTHAHVSHGHFASAFHKDNDQLREQEELLINEVMNLNFDATKMSYLNFPMDYSQPTSQANGQARRGGPPGFDSASRSTGYQPPKAAPPGFGSQSSAQVPPQPQSGYYPPSISRVPPGLENQRNAQQPARPPPGPTPGRSRAGARRAPSGGVRLRPAGRIAARR